MCRNGSSRSHLFEKQHQRKTYQAREPEDAKIFDERPESRLIHDEVINDLLRLSLRQQWIRLGGKNGLR